LANDHLWLHFTRMGGYEPPIIVRGDGCYLEDANGKRYLDALAGLFCVNIGYGFGEEMSSRSIRTGRTRIHVRSSWRPRSRRSRPATSTGSSS
jgi:acetylornithine/succinyldiaminopimelate/putrescine aminotransferase